MLYANSVEHFCYFSQGNLVAVGTHKGYVQIWDVAATKKINTLEGHSARVGMYRPLSFEMTKHWQLLLGQLIFNNSLPKDWHHTHWLLLSFYLCVVSWGFALVETWYSDWTWEPTRLIKYCYSSFSFLIWHSCSVFHRPNNPHTIIIMYILLFPQFMICTSLLTFTEYSRHIQCTHFTSMRHYTHLIDHVT